MNQTRLDRHARRIARHTKRSERALREYRSKTRPETCEVCSRKGRIAYDHSHETGWFRGWLCNGCNLTLGLVKDDPEILRKLADYLEYHNDFKGPVRYEPPIEAQYTMDLSMPILHGRYLNIQQV
jgi:hypothetical protein